MFIEDAIRQMDQIVTDSKRDAEKFLKGNASAGTRLRVSMQEVKKLANTIREEVLNIRKRDAEKK